MKYALKLYETLGIFLAVLSIVALIAQILNGGIHGPLMALANYYSAFVTVIFAPIEPFAARVARMMGNLLGLHMKLYPHWKHILVLMWLYLGSQARRTSWTKGHQLSAIVIWSLAFSVALAIALLAGSLALDRQPFTVGLLIIIPVSGVLLFELLSTIWYGMFAPFPRIAFESLIRFEFAPLAVFSIFFACVVVAFFLYNGGGNPWGPNAGLGAAGAVFVLMLSYKLIKGIREATRVTYRGLPEGRPAFTTRGFWRMAAEYSRGGKQMLEVVAGLVLFLATNAGLTSLGL